MSNLFNLVAKLTLDSSEYESGLDKAESGASSFGSKLKSGLGAAAKVGTAAVGAAAAGVAAMVKQSVDSFGNYEQLAGGIETLFGNSASKVIEDSQNAFQTAGMSMNDYMETSIQSAAALINSLGGDQAKAAEMMNMSITDMSDNVNKMGTSMESVQDAYRGFSRGNFTMLDNLALGFAGTKEGMQQLLDKAQEISGVKYDISSYSDIVEAIHVVQTEMGITGTTAKEASSTIQGSIGATKAAWENLVTGISDKDADIGKLVDNLISTAGTAAGNLLPVIEQSLTGIGEAVVKIAPELGKALTGLVTNVLPSLTSSALELVTALGSALLQNAPMIIDSALQIVQILVTGLVQSTPQLITGAMQIVTALVNGLGQMAPMLVTGAAQLIAGLDTALTDPGTLGALLQSAVVLVQGLADGLLQAIPTLVAAVPTIIQNLVAVIVQNAPMLITAAGQIMVQLAVGLIQAIPSLLESADEIVASIAQGIVELAPRLLEAGKELAKSAWEGIKSIFKGGDKADASESVDFSGLQSKSQEAASSMSSISSAASQTASSVTSSFSTISTAADFTQLGTNAQTAFTGMTTSAQTASQSITDTFSSVGTGVSENINAGLQSVEWSTMSSGASETVQSVKSSFAELPPQLKADFEMIKQAARELHRFVKQQFDQMAKEAVNAWQPVPGQINTYFQQIQTNVHTLATNVTNEFTTLTTNATQWGRDMITNFGGGIDETSGALLGTIETLAAQIKRLLGFSEPEEGPLSDFHTYAPDMMKLFAQGVKENTGLVRDQLEKSFNFNQPEITYSKVSSGRSASGTDRKLDELTAILTQYLPQLANMQIVMNSGVTVGALLPEIDSQLGQRYRVKERAGA